MTSLGNRHRGPAHGSAFRLAGRLCLLLCLCLGASPAAAQEDADGSTSPSGWAQRLREHTDDFATSRLLLRQAQQAAATGNVDRARELLSEASEEDPRFGAPHQMRARLELTRQPADVAGAVYEGMHAVASGYRNQSLALSNLLLTFDLTLGFVLLWLVGISLIRYLPFARHQLATALLSSDHGKRRAQLLSLGIAVPLLVTAAWGALPWLAVALPTVWVFADRRVRLILGVVLGLLVIQVAWSRPFGALLLGVDPTSRASLLERAAYEPPTPHLLEEIDAAMARRGGDDADLLSAKGLVLARRGNFARSRETLVRTLSLRPDDAAATNNLATAHFFLGDLDRAVAGFQRSVAIDSTRAAPYYNLSQAYMQKLFLKEGGLALQRAMRRGFALTEQVERLPRGAVYFARPRLADYWRLAWSDGADFGVLGLLGPHARWLGVPSAHVGRWLMAIAIACAVLGLVTRRRNLVFECANCGALACPGCQGEHEGTVLCVSCAGTARRAKSEVVLQTLLRNRRRDAESAYQRRIRLLDAWLLGAGQVADGMRRRGVVTAFFLGAAMVGLALGGPPLRDTWDFESTPWLSVARIVSAITVLLLFFANGAWRTMARHRHLQPHPASEVSLVRLIEGRPAERARAGGGS